MPQPFSSPQDAEDALYDAIDARDLDALLAVWEDSEAVACLLPMQALARGRAGLREAWRPLLTGPHPVELQVRHIQWLELGDIAIHYVEELASIPDQPQPMLPVYGTNVYRRGADGWRLILHQNSPTPPPPGLVPPMIRGRPGN